MPEMIWGSLIWFKAYCVVKGYWALAACGFEIVVAMDSCRGFMGPHEHKDPECWCQGPRQGVMS